MSCDCIHPAQTMQETHVPGGLTLHRLPVALWLNCQPQIAQGEATNPKGRFLLNLLGHLQEQAYL